MRYRLSNWMRTRLNACIYLALLSSITVFGQDTGDIRGQIAALEEQNQSLMALITRQQSELERLRDQVVDIEERTNRQSENLKEIQEQSADIAMPAIPSPAGGRVHISGHAGVIFRAGEANTNFPNEEFKVDEARVMLEAQVSEGIYLVSQLDLFDRENDNSDVEIGEFFIEFEDILDNGSLSVRAGRLQIPFGEEYQNRYVMENPLISHSVSDFWGLDEGLEAFGRLGEVSYVAAILNGGHDFLRDHSSSKSLVGRISIDPTSNIHLSGSVMRTGDIDIRNEMLTELWFGNAFFRSIGSEATTRFDVDLAQTDATYSWQSGKIAAAYGQAWYKDDDPLADNRRDFKFWQIEARQSLNDHLVAAIRYSGMDVDRGYPVSGMANRGKYFFDPIMTEELRRLSLGFSYWPYPDLVLKLDYTLEDGEETNGAERKDTDMLAAEIGARF